MGHFWHDYLYEPLINVLFYLYAGPAFGNIGVAIIELTVLLRLLLLPFTIINERSRYRFEQLNAKIVAIERDFRNDPVKKKDKIRELLKTHKVNYWSKSIVLGVQALVLILLYQVFLGGLRFTSFEKLYSWVPAPRDVHTMFLGFDLAHRNMITAVACGVVLFFWLYTEQKRREHLVTKSDVMYVLFFPLFTFVVLLLLPSVKSLFVLTSMLFSITVQILRRAVFKVDVQEE
jgi:YidC/Oxa1 family membrane protein insertase